MAKSNICYHNVRLNLDNEQHCRIHKVLAGLNRDIHKSVNQFIIDAIDFYIRSMDDGNFAESVKEQKKDAGYITKDDLGGIQAELKSEVKNEIIMLLGAALGAGTMKAAEGIAGRNGIKNRRVGVTAGTNEAGDPTMMELVDDWG